MNVLVLHGPNLNLLGERPGDPPGQTLAEVDRQIRQRAAELGVTVKITQSNHEGLLIDALHAERHWMEGVIINPSSLGPTSIALRDAISAVQKPAFEVHLTDIRKGETWRRKSMLKDVCEGQLMGKGVQSYLKALERLVAEVKGKGGKRPLGKGVPRAAAEPAKPVVKTLGRRPAVAGAAPEPAAKTLGRVPPPQTPHRASQLGFLTRALVRQKIADRLAGKLSAADLATWARGQWQEVQRGAPAESGQRELLEELLQSLLLSALPPSQLSDDQLVELMTRLDG
jgi:3-dehydroquinate dehydratase-2